MSQNNPLFSVSSYFQFNYSFEAQTVCNAIGIDIKEECVIRFYDNNTVSRYGNETTPGTFQADPDIAGLGIWGGMSPGVVICILALLFFLRECGLYLPDARFLRPTRLRVAKLFEKRRKVRETDVARFYRIIRGLVIGTADTQTIIALGYGINFGLSGKCSISAYHYNVGVNTILCACSTITLSVIMVRDYWRGFMAPFLRFLISSAIFAVLGRFLWYQNARDTAPESVGWSLSGKGNNTDSTIFLPIACFLDPDLNPLRDLTDAEKTRVGGGPGAGVTEFILFWITVVWFITGHISHIIQCKFRYGNDDGRPKKHMKRHLAVRVHYFFSLCFCTVVYCACWGHIYKIREFVHGTPWMEGGNTYANPERNVQGIGQLIPLVAIAWVLINGLDVIS